MDRQGVSFKMGQRLKDLREERGLSHVDLIKQLSEKYGISISRDSLMAYEIADESRAKASKLPNLGMRVEYLYCLADFFDVSLDYLLGRSNVSKPDFNIGEICKKTNLSEGIVQVLYANQKYAKPNTGGRVFTTDGFNEIFNPAHKVIFFMKSLSKYVSYVNTAKYVIASAKQDLSNLDNDNEDERIHLNNELFLKINTALQDVRYSHLDIIDYMTELISGFASNSGIDDRSCGPDILYPDDIEIE